MKAAAIQDFGFKLSKRLRSQAKAHGKTNARPKTCSIKTTSKGSIFLTTGKRKIPSVAQSNALTAIKQDPRSLDKADFISFRFSSSRGPCQSGRSRIQNDLHATVFFSTEDLVRARAFFERH